RCCIYLTPAWLALCADRRTIGRCSAASALWPNLSALRLRCHFNFRCLQKRPLTRLAPGPVCPAEFGEPLWQRLHASEYHLGSPGCTLQYRGQACPWAARSQRPQRTRCSNDRQPRLINRQTFGCRREPGSVVGTGPCGLQSPLLLGALLHSQG